MRLTTQSLASSCVRDEEMRLKIHEGFTKHTQNLSAKRNDSAPQKKWRRWLHISRRRNCRCWMRSKPNYLVVCEQKKHFFHLTAGVTRSSVASEHLKVPQPTLLSRRQPKNKTSDTSQTDRIRNALETTCENKKRGTNTLREL